MGWNWSCVCPTKGWRQLNTCFWDANLQEWYGENQCSWQWWDSCILHPNVKLGIDNKKENEFSLNVVIIMDTIWHCRNKVVHNGGKTRCIMHDESCHVLAHQNTLHHNTHLHNRMLNIMAHSSHAKPVWCQLRILDENLWKLLVKSFGNWVLVC